MAIRFTSQIFFQPQEVLTKGPLLGSEIHPHVWVEPMLSMGCSRPVVSTAVIPRQAHSLGLWWLAWTQQPCRTFFLVHCNLTCFGAAFLPFLLHSWAGLHHRLMALAASPSSLLFSLRGISWKFNEVLASRIDLGDSRLCFWSVHYVVFLFMKFISTWDTKWTHPSSYNLLSYFILLLLKICVYVWLSGILHRL